MYQKWCGGREVVVVVRGQRERGRGARGRGVVAVVVVYAPDRLQAVTARVTVVPFLPSISSAGGACLSS